MCQTHRDAETFPMCTARLTVTHADLPNEAARDEIAGGWPAVMANLKSLLETGHALPQTPWDMPAS